jgi:hypothetical protein
MSRNALIASVVALGAAGAAQAQDGGPRLIGSGADAQVVYAEPSRNLVGGGVATTCGSSDDRTIAYPLCQGSCPAPRDDLSFSAGRDGGVSWPTRRSAVRRS